MSRKQKIIISVTGIFIVLLILVGLTYAYFLTRISGNTNTKSISVTTADLKLTYGDGNGDITAEKIEPGTIIDTKTFTVTNEGNATVNNYAVYLEELVNTLSRTSDMVYTLTCTSSVENKTCNGKTETTFPTQNGMLVTNNIDVKETQSYELKVEYKEMNVDQSEDMNKTISAKVQIYNLADIVDITGTVTNASTGDYVEMQSNPKTSQIRDNKYFIPAIEPGTHTLYVKDKDGTVKGSKQITINKGSESSINGDTITVTSDSQTISLNITNISSTLTTDIGSVEDYNPFDSGTLASAIFSKGLKKAQLQETKISNIDVSKYKNYYITYGNGYTFDEKTNKFNLTETSTCKYSECISSLLNKYVVSSDFSKTSKDTNTKVETTNLNNVYKITNITLEDDTSTTAVINDDSNSLSYYMTYGTSYTTSGNKITLTNTTTCKLSECGDLTGKYIAADAIQKTEELALKKSSNLSGVYEITNILAWTDSMVYFYVSGKSFTGVSMSRKFYNSGLLLSTQDDLGNSYYYNGNVENNYISFANKCFKIVRIAGNGSIKLILFNNDNVCSNTITSNALIGGGIDPYGYKEFGGINVANYTSYNYVSNFSQTDKEKLVLTQTCLGDDGNLYDKNGKILTDSKETLITNALNEYNSTNKLTNYYTYNSTARYNKNEYTLTCNGKKTTESYSYPITIDEYYFSGGSNGFLNDISKYWKTVTVGKLGISESNTLEETYYTIESDGKVSNENTVSSSGDYSEHTRPMISLKPNIEFASGDGTLENPYTVK